jgi:hypothetical protein
MIKTMIPNAKGTSHLTNFLLSEPLAFASSTVLVEPIHTPPRKLVKSAALKSLPAPIPHQAGGCRAWIGDWRLALLRSLQPALPAHLTRTMISAAAYLDDPWKSTEIRRRFP